jgi:hypothetical protein
MDAHPCGQQALPVPLKIHVLLEVSMLQHLLLLTTATRDSKSVPDSPLSEYQQHSAPPDMFAQPPAPLRFIASAPLIPETHSSSV